MRHYESNVLIKVTTCDGASSNISMLEKLGVSLDPEEIKPFFKHPCDENVNVYATLDYCHMLKLCRNALEHFQRFYTEYGVVDFNHFVLLVQVQEKMNLRLGNKLTKGHVQFKNDKMRTRLAVQLFSQSTAKSLTCMTNLGVEEFKNSKIL